MRIQSKLAEVRVNKVKVCRVALWLSIVLSVVGLLLAQLLPDHISLAQWDALPFLISFLVILPAHEALHAVGLIIFARVSWSDIRFGATWRPLTLHCHCTVSILLRAYRQMALLPLWITGGATILLFLIFRADWLGVLAGCTIASCVGDIWLVAKLKGLPDDLLVQDSSSQIGCDVFSTIRESAE